MTTITETTSPESQGSIRLTLSQDNEQGSYFSMGLQTHKVYMRMHAENRARLLARFKDAPSNSIILFQGGEQEMRNFTDHEPVFRQESFFQWVFGVHEADCWGALDVETGRSILYIPRLPEEYAVWMGEIRSLEFFQKFYEVDEVRYVDELADTLCSLEKENVYLLHGKNTDSGKTIPVPSVPALPENIKVDTSKLHTEICECRVFKSDMELDVLRYANRISSIAHVKVMQACKVGMKEYQLESLFRHITYSEGGCRHQAYTCICGSGINSATLHYGHAGAPNDKTLNETDMLLMDMGGEYHCYASDITCSYPATGKFSEKQKIIYEAVLAAQNAVLAAIKPGVSWVDMHLLSERASLEKLIEGGLLKGDIEDMMAARLGAVFQPHGLGHFMGIDTHDVGGYPEGVERRTEKGLRSLRTARILQPRMVITVEPGVYFIDAVLLPALENPETSHFFVREKIEEYRGFGGIRLEDDVIVTETGVENMTKCPRTIEEVERVMAGGEWTI